VILDEIVENKRAEIARREAEIPVREQQRRARSAPAPRTPDFSRPMAIIAEVKRRSPSAGEIEAEVDPVAQAREYQAAGANVISVLCDQKYFGGSLDDLRAVREAVSLPVLCKDFVISPYQLYEARACGADLALLILAALDDRTFRDLLALVLELDMTPLVEVHNQHELARAIAADSPVIGINNRDLTDFSVDLLTTEYLAPLIPDEMVIVSESGIKTREDVERVQRAGARVVLVGEALMRAESPAAALAELLG
jgi:indole-3-glycerol phosphate synthase